MLKSNIKQVSKLKGLSIRELASNVGISKTSAFRYESEVEIMQIGVANKICKELGVPIHELVDGFFNLEVQLPAPPTANEPQESYGQGSPDFSVIESQQRTIEALVMGKDEQLQEAARIIMETNKSLSEQTIKNISTLDEIRRMESYYEELDELDGQISGLDSEIMDFDDKIFKMIAKNG